MMPGQRLATEDNAVKLRPTAGKARLSGAYEPSPPGPAGEASMAAYLVRDAVVEVRQGFLQVEGRVHRSGVHAE